MSPIGSEDGRAELLFQSEMSMPLSKDSQTLIDFHMELFPHRILVRTSKDKPISGCIQVEYCRFDLAFDIPKGKKLVHLIELSSSKGSTCLCSSNKELILEWAKHLRKFTVCYNFELDFEARDKVGEGTYGTVITAKSRRDGRHYAVKRFDKERLQKDQGELGFILNELKITSVLHHPDCVRLVAVYEDQRWLYLVTNIFTGNELLLKVLVQDGLDHQEVLRLGYHLLHTLTYLEKQQILHHDIKPQNLIFRDSSDTSDLCLIDFGLAVQLRDGNPCQDVNGTKGFTAPEVNKGLPHSCNADVYSVGVVIFFMLVAELPQQLQAMWVDENPSIHERVKSVHQLILDKKGVDVPIEGRFA